MQSKLLFWELNMLENSLKFLVSPIKDTKSLILIEFWMCVAGFAPQHPLVGAPPTGFTDQDEAPAVSQVSWRIKLHPTGSQVFCIKYSFWLFSTSPYLDEVFLELSFNQLQMWTIGKKALCRYRCSRGLCSSQHVTVPWLTTLMFCSENKKWVFLGHPWAYQHQISYV